uniref:Uncharacterized protein n=1 Tax=Solanum lycopersicum TaxID=4081 RepID=A0A3Q7IDX3_SOLLC
MGNSLKVEQVCYLIAGQDKDDFATSLAQKYGLHKAVGCFVDASLYRMIVGSLRYLTLTKHNINYPILYTLDSKSFHKNLLGCMDYLDVDWGGCTTTKRSTISYIINIGANCIS